MCDPVTIGLTLLAVSQVAQGYQAKQQGDFAEEVSDFNARQQENEATRTRNLGVEEENKQRRATAELLSRQRAQLGAAGVELGTGSAFLLQEDTTTLGEVDALRIRSNFEQRAEGLELGAELTRAQGDAAREAGRTAFATSLLSAAGTGLSGAPSGAPSTSPFGGGAQGSGVSSKWYTQSSAAFTAFTA